METILELSVYLCKNEAWSCLSFQVALLSNVRFYMVMESTGYPSEDSCWNALFKFILT